MSILSDIDVDLIYVIELESAYKELERLDASRTFNETLMTMPWVDHLTSEINKKIVADIMKLHETDILNKTTEHYERD